MLRRARPDDARAIARLFRASFGTLTFLPTLHTPEEDERHLASMIADREVWVYEDEREIAGFAAVTDDMLSDLYVAPDRLREGIGSVLLERAKERRPAGFRFWVFQQNERARRFYERHGCRVVELTDGSGNEEKVPDALYEWAPQIVNLQKQIHDRDSP
ncbi:MAG TPA: GNAT family N-acetyltransferase [Gaiellaceae bacterium]|nr:GNAT family N-acetyltransferase [Gaiellaceae bacterium]